MKLYPLGSSYLNKLHDIADKLSGKAHVDEFRSEMGSPIYAVRFGKAPTGMISFGGVHGDETEAMNGVLRTLEMLYEGRLDGLLDNVSYTGVPVLNIDMAGMGRRRRYNAGRKNINRDFGKYCLIFGSCFTTKEAQAAREILQRNNPVLVMDHHSDLNGDFYTMEYGKTEASQKIAEKIGMRIKREAMKNFARYVESFCPKERGMLVNYASRTCPAILVEFPVSELHTMADVAALEEMASLYAARTNPSVPREMSRQADKFSLS